jgi:adenylate cyclase
MHGLIIGNAVDFTARLQSKADGIMLGHETYAAEEQKPFKIKGFAEPVRAYKVLDLCDDLAAEGLVICEEQDAFRFLLDLQKHDKATAIGKVEAQLAPLKK